MNPKLTVTIKKRSLTGWLVWLLIMLPFFFGTLIDLLGLPSVLKYTLDVAWCILAVILFLSKRNRRGAKINNLMIWVGLFLLYTALVYIVQFQSPLYYLWGVRNNFRFYIAFFAFMAFLSQSDVDDYFKFFDVLFWINVVVSLAQFFGLGLARDYLGGIFGAEQGCNGYTNVFFVIMITKSILFYLEKRESALSCVAKCVAALLVAALAELKFFFAEFAIILVLASLFTSFTWRKLWVISGGFAAVVAFAALLSALFPIFSNFLSLEFFLNTGLSDKGYTSSGDLNRLNAIPQINELWLKNWGEQLFGLGLGNCDNSAYDFLTTPFFKLNVDMHYTWLSYAFMYLETGYLGLLFYYGFFALVYLKIRKIERRSEGIVRTYCRIGRILAICCVLISVYNSSLRTEAGYMMFFALAVPFAVSKTEMKSTTELRRMYGQ